MIRQLQKRFGSFSVILCAALILVAVFPFNVTAAEAARDKVRVGYYENEVFQEGAQEGSVKTGYAYEYYQKLSEYTGWNYEYVEGNWGQLVQKLINGEIDMLGGVSYTEARANVVLFSSYPMGTEEYYLFIDGDISPVTDNHSVAKAVKPWIRGQRSRIRK